MSTGISQSSGTNHVQDASHVLPARVNVYSLRNPADIELAAREIASGKIAAFYGGLYGIVKGVRPWGDHEDAETYWRVKTGRARYSKVPLLIKPQDAIRLIDFRLVHPEYRHLERRENFNMLFNSHGAPLHVIAPLREPLPFMRSAFKTDSQDLASQAQDDPTRSDRLTEYTTASFFWMDDPAWDSFATLASLYSKPRMFFGVSSFNNHGEQPPYTYEELLRDVSARGECKFDLVINDEMYEESGAFSSHTQIRLPTHHETPELVMVRRGALSADWFSSATGYPVHELESATTASRSPGISDAKLESDLRKFVSLRRAL